MRRVLVVFLLSAVGCGGQVGDGDGAEEASALAGCYTTIDAKYQAFGGPAGFLGQPLIPESSTARGDGTHRAFQFGAIYKRHGGCAFEVHGGIAAKWGELRWETGELGFPVSDEEDAGDGWGRVSHFENGSLYWSGGAAVLIRPDIRNKWLSLGGVRSALNYPARDPVKGGGATVQEFRGGFMFAPPLKTIRFLTSGPILTLYRAMGLETGLAGLPTSDESACWPQTLGWRCQRFENGLISWGPSGTRFIR
jgi:hypothetical protein